MKKTLVLASLLAAFGAASAQSSVTLYGYGDQGLGKSIVATGTTTKVQLNPGTSDVGGVRIGLRGTEALGNGLSAKFGLETGTIGGDTGADALNFSRAAWFGLAGGFGEVRLGRHATIAVMNAGTQTNFGWRGTNSQVGLGLRGGIDCQTAACGASSRTSAALTFLSANYSGLTFAAQASLKDDGYYAAKGGTQFAVGYAAGPLKAEANMTNMGGAKTQYVGAQYAFGSVTAGLGYMGTESVAAVKNAGITARVKAKFGAADVGLEVTKQTKLAKATGVELAMDYNLSPRTALTAAVNKTTDMNAGYYAGVRHAF
jgi:predicted porin